MSCITQGLSLKHKNFRLAGRARTVLLTAILAVAGLTPVAFANCKSGPGGGVGIPLIPGTSAAALSATSQNTGKSKTPVSIVGLWNVSFLSNNTVVDVGFDAWHSDGTEILNDYTDPINGNVCLGVWEQTGTRNYKLKHPSWYFDGAGNLLGTVIIRETVCLSADGNSYNGSYTYDVYDVTGNFMEELSGQLQATRIRAD